MTGKSFTPTAEQEHALSLFSSGDNLAIEAGAGTGKTSTLFLLANSTSRRGQYIAFNKAIVAEAGRKMPGNVNCSTAHSLAFRAVGGQFASRMRNGKRMKSYDIALKLGIDPLKVTLDEEATKLLGPSFIAGLTLSAINRFCQSADEMPTAKHVPFVEGLDPAGTGRGPVNQEVAKHVERYLPRAWADLTVVDGMLPFMTSTAMSVILKLWHLSDPKIGADFILFDEAQDANPVMNAVVTAQTHAQLVWVGDSQQQIYGFTGAINALDAVPADNRAYLTQSFRFGPPIADVANVVLGMLSADLRLRGTPSISSVVAPVAEPDAILCRTNATAVRTLLLEQLAGRRVHLVGGGTEIVSFAKAARTLQNGERTEHPDLACFETWGEVLEYVQNDEQGKDLELNVKLITEFGVEAILKALDSNTREDQADVIISTAHKSKGREWDSVQLAADFPPSFDQAEELRLLYVALTRAARELDVASVALLQEMSGATAGVAVVRHEAPVWGTAAPAGEPVEEKPDSQHVGEVGQQMELTLGVEWIRDEPTKFGSYMHRLTDEHGNTFTAFLPEKLEEGGVYTATWKIQKHEEFRGVKQTTVAYPSRLTAISA